MAKKRRTPPPPPRPVQAPMRRDTGGRRGVDRRLVGAVVVAAVVVIGIVVGLVVGLGGSSSTSAKQTIPWVQLPGLQKGKPPWNNDSATLPDRLVLIGLDQLTAEGEVLHIHQHLDLYVNGKHVTVPARIGIYDNSWLTELHTHDATGIIHIESPTKRDFTLGQFFGTWGVRLTQTCVGTPCGSVTWWVNGVKQSGDPASLVLRAHQEIAIAEGTPPTAPPRSYNFPAGL